MKRSSQVVAAALCTMMLSAPAYAQDDPDALADRLIELARVDQMMHESGKAFMAGYKDQLDRAFKRERPELSDEQLAELYAIVDNELALVTDQIKGPIRDMMRAFYVDNFSADELEALLEIHSSEVYQKQYSLMPQMMEKVAGVTAEQQLAMQQRLNERVKDWLERNK